MATTKATKGASSPAASPAVAGGWNPSTPCPVCREAIHMYVPPDRSLGGPVAYPALLLHFEEKHDRMEPPAPPEGDFWDQMPPAPADWRPLDKELLRKQLPQPAGVWPPLRTPKSQPE